jgi:hypothetical protein
MPPTPDPGFARVGTFDSLNDGFRLTPHPHTHPAERADSRVSGLARYWYETKTMSGLTCIV